MQALLIDLGWKSALIAGAVLIACQALRGRAAGERVMLLRLGVGALLALPLLALWAPPIELAVLPAEEIARAASAIGDRTIAAAEPGTGGGLDWILLVYGAGAALVLLRLGVGLFTLLRWTRAASPATDPHWKHALVRAAAGIGRPVRLLVSRKVDAPMSWGVVPAWILIGPETEYRSAQAEAVLAHEMAHVRRFDWPMLMLARLAVALLWFNPLVWWLGRTLVGQVELAADEEAVSHVARLDYAQTLLAVGAGSAHHSACGMTYARSTLGRRIRDVLAGPRRSASRLRCAAMLVAAMATAGPLAALKLVPVAAQAAPEPVIASYLPAIIPQAQAREVQEAPKPVPPRKRKKLVTRATTVAVVTPSKPTAPPSPSELVRPKAPGAIAAEAARVETRRVIEHARLVAHVRVAGGRPRIPSDDRRKALGMSEAAKGMRAEAQSMEAMAADPSTPREIRQAHVRTASNLRREAQNLDRDARRLIIKP